MTLDIRMTHNSCLIPSPKIDPKFYCLLNRYDLIDVLLVSLSPVRSQHNIESFSTWMHPLNSLHHLLNNLNHNFAPLSFGV